MGGSGDSVQQEGSRDLQNIVCGSHSTELNPDTMCGVQRDTSEQTTGNVDIAQKEGQA